MDSNANSKDILEFEHSFGYNSLKLHNICVYDDYRIIWAAGSIITFYDTDEKKLSFKRSYTGGSVGNIIKFPNSGHIAVGEGFSFDNPSAIVIYDYPTLTIVKKLEDGSKSLHSCLCFNVDGSLLASISGEPENKLSIWDMKNNCIKLQSKPASQPIFDVCFSSYDKEQLVTCGKNHIMFWNMTKTFTGLKLINEHGFFGKNDISDIFCTLSMPDGKILSGCSWGNILIWDSSSIKFEVSRKGRRPCHNGSIMQFIYKERKHELMTIGLDGQVCIWPWDTVLEAETNAIENDPFIEINSLAENVFADAKLMHISFQGSANWFAQDARGGISILNLTRRRKSIISMTSEIQSYEDVIQSHGSGVAGLALLRFAPYLISIGYDGTVLLHKLPSGPTKALESFSEHGTCTFCFPSELDKTGNMLIVGFRNGTIRVLVFNFYHGRNDDINYKCIQTLKPHSAAVNVICFNDNLNNIITGSDDCNIFIYQVVMVKLVPNLVPLYFIQTPNTITCISWKPDSKNTILISGIGGYILQGVLPIFNSLQVSDTITTYKRDFLSFKISYIKQYTLYPKKVVENVDVHSKIANFITDENDFELVAENKSISDVMVTSIMYDSSNFKQIWITQKECNCLINIDLDYLKINSFIPLKGFTQNYITSLTKIERNMFLSGMNNGEIRIFNMPSLTTINLTESSLSDSKFREKKLRGITKNKKLELIFGHQFKTDTKTIFSMHDYAMGNITQLIIDYGKKVLYTAGGDGNIFSLKFNYQKKKTATVSNNENKEEVLKLEMLPENKSDSILSHEEYLKEQQRRLLEKDTFTQKADMTDQFKQIKEELKSLYIFNKTLPQNLQITFDEESRVQEHIFSEFATRIQIIKRKLDFSLETSNLKLHKMMHRNINHLDVFPFEISSLICNDYSVRIIRQKKLPNNFFGDYEALKKKYSEMILLSKDELFYFPGKTEEVIEDDDVNIIENMDENPTAPLLENFPINLDLPRPLTKAIGLYLERLEKQRILEIESKNQLLKYSVDIAKEPKMSNETVSTDVYYLKTQLDKISQPSKKYEIKLKTFSVKMEIFEIVNKFNNTLLEIREKKLDIFRKYKNDCERLKEISNELPDYLVKPPHYFISEFNYDQEFPDKNLELEDHLMDQLSEDLLNIKINNKNESSNASNKHNIDLVLEQNEIINEMKNYIENWEQSLKKCGNQRENIVLKAQFLKLHLLYLMREQLVHDSFEPSESLKLHEIQESQNHLQRKNEELQLLQTELDLNKEKRITFVHQKKKLYHHLCSLASNDRFGDFLKRVYKDSQHSSESRSSSPISNDEKEEDDGDFMDDFQARNMNLDSNACPPGCDPQVYEQVLKLKSTRNEIDFKIKEIETEISHWSKKIESQNNSIKDLLKILKSQQNELKDIMAHKQDAINNIECIIVLSPLQCMSNAFENAEKSTGILVFPENIIQDLKSRVNDLNNETEDQRKKYNINKEHLKRMRADCDFMNEKIDNLQKQIQSIITQKLGIDSPKNKNDSNTIKKKATKILDDTLQSMIHQFKLKISAGLSKEMENQLYNWKKKQSDLEQQYCIALQEHTKKLERATMLQAEVLSYMRLHKTKTKHTDREQFDCQNDVLKLRQIENRQQKQIEELRNEIQRLKRKPYTATIPPIPPTNISLSPSIAVSPIMSDILQDSTKSIVKALANELNEMNVQLEDGSNQYSTLMESLTEILPLLIQGKLNSGEAANKIIQFYRTEKSSDVKNKFIKKIEDTIIDIINQCSDQNLKTKNLTMTKNLTPFVGSEIKCTIQELLNAAISPDDKNTIKIAISSLLEIAPHIRSEEINFNDIVISIQGEHLHDNELIEEMTIAVTECLISCVAVPVDIALLQNIQEHSTDIEDY